MNERVRGILSRILSQEIAHQEQWKDDDASKGFANRIDRDAIIAELKDFMSENEIPFDHQHYIEEF